MSDEILTVEEAAALLKISAYTVRKLARQGELPGRKVGKDWRFSRWEIVQGWRRPGNGGLIGFYSQERFDDRPIKCSHRHENGQLCENEGVYVDPATWGLVCVDHAPADRLPRPFTFPVTLTIRGHLLLDALLPQWNSSMGDGPPSPGALISWLLENYARQEVERDLAALQSGEWWEGQDLDDHGRKLMLDRIRSLSEALAADLHPLRGYAPDLVQRFIAERLSGPVREALATDWAEAHRQMAHEKKMQAAVVEMLERETQKKELMRKVNAVSPRPTVPKQVDDWSAADHLAWEEHVAAYMNACLPPSLWANRPIPGGYEGCMRCGNSGQVWTVYLPGEYPDLTDCPVCLGRGIHLRRKEDSDW